LTKEIPGFEQYFFSTFKNGQIFSTGYFDHFLSIGFIMPFAGIFPPNLYA
jgi:hypothetical protein